MTDPVPALIGVAVLSGAALAGIAGLARVTGMPSEVLRKAVHVVSGTIALCFPWIFPSAWPVLFLAGTTAGAMLSLRLFPGWLRRVKRWGFAPSLRLDSLGDVTFPVAIALLFLLAGDRHVFYTAPLLVATWADAAAAVVGKRLGRLRYTPPFGGTKTWEGTVACFVVAYTCLATALGADAGHLTPRLIAVSLGGAALTTSLEALAWSGLDNLFVPLGAWTYLRLIL